MYICKICKRELTFKGLKNHLFRTHWKTEGLIKSENDAWLIYFEHFMSKYDMDKILDYYLIDKISTNDICRRMPDINEYIICLFLKFKNVSFRTSKEIKQLDSYKSKISTTLKERYNVDNISKIIAAKDKKKNTMMKSHGYINQFCNKEILDLAHSRVDHQKCHDSLVKSLQAKYGDNVTNPMHIPGVIDNIDWAARRKNIESTCMRQWGVKNVYQREDIRAKAIAAGCGTSKLELKIQDILNSIGIEYHAHKRILNYYVDIFIPETNTVIEINGDYWHASPKKYLAEDKINYPGNIIIKAKTIWSNEAKRQKRIEAKGFKVKVIWENEIESADNLMELIINTINQ